MRLTKLVARLVANRPQDLVIRRDDKGKFVLLFEHSETFLSHNFTVPVKGRVVFGPVDATFVQAVKDEIIKLRRKD